jgi:hypothetical protein
LEARLGTTNLHLQPTPDKDQQCGTCRAPITRARLDDDQIVLVEAVAFGRGPERLALTPDLFGGLARASACHLGSTYRVHHCPRIGGRK